MIDEFTAKQLQKLVDQYVETRSRRHDFVSTQAAHRALSQIVPLAGMSERALDDLIADRALSRGLVVCFDRVAETGGAK